MKVSSKYGAEVLKVSSKYGAEVMKVSSKYGVEVMQTVIRTVLSTQLILQNVKIFGVIYRAKKSGVCVLKRYG